MGEAAAVKERPILFSAPMVRAILEGRKTQTRRVVKLGGDCEWHVAPHPDGRMWPSWNAAPGTPFGEWYWLACPYGDAGDRLWVRERLERHDGVAWYYHADGREVLVSREHECAMVTWCHHKMAETCVSIHMPRWASRITLRITSVRVERLHDITEDDAEREGVAASANYSARQHFARLWTEINGAGSWGANPWVWVIGFERTTPEAGEGDERGR